MALLTHNDIHVTIGDRHLLQGVSLVVGEGERIGLLGANGCGKSTLLRILAGDLVADAGDRAMRRELRIGYLPQEPVLPPDATVHEAVVAGLPTAQNVFNFAQHYGVGEVVARETILLTTIGCVPVLLLATVLLG